MKQDILSHLPGDFPWQVQYFDLLPSTNTYLKELAAKGAPHGLCVIAESQSAGRGRMGRSFLSLANRGLYLSVLLRPNCKAEELMHLTCAVGLAVCDAIEDATGYQAGIKWINDLVAGNKKLGGILTELSVDPATANVDYAVIGIGINLSGLTFPPELEHIATSLEAVTGNVPKRDILTAKLLIRLEQISRELLQKKAAIMTRYRDLCVTLGKEITLVRSDACRQGTALDITEDGSLLVKFSDGSIQAVNSGEVSVRGLYGYL